MEENSLDTAHTNFVHRQFGAKRTPQLSARYASEFNVAFAPPDAYPEIVGETCRLDPGAALELVGPAGGHLAQQLVANAQALKARHGFRVHKLKGGVYPPAHELACYRALAAALPDDRFRYDPNSALSLADAIDFGRGIEDLPNDYFEDPVWGMPQLARLKEFVPIPIATNTVIVNFEQLAANVLDRAVDVDLPHIG